jgi:hypothetical protein
MSQKRPSPPPVAPFSRPSAPHVQATVPRAAQAKLPERCPAPLAAHVRGALAAAQAKASAAAPDRRPAPHVRAVVEAVQAKTSPAAAPRTAAPHVQAAVAIGKQIQPCRAPIGSPRPPVVVQPLKIYQTRVFAATAKSKGGTGTDYEALVETRDLSKESYERLNEYLAMFEEQKRSGIDYKKAMESQGGGLPNANYIFEDGEEALMRKLIHHYEAAGAGSAPRVVCYEGNVKVVAAGQAGFFGGVSSCMTLTVVLSDGRKVLAHAGLMAPITLAAVQRVVAGLGGQVAKVVAAGVGDLWGTNLEPGGGTAINDNVAAFRATLRRVFGTATAEFRNLEGTIRVTPEGDVLTQERGYFYHPSGVVFGPNVSFTGEGGERKAATASGESKTASSGHSAATPPSATPSSPAAPSSLSAAEQEAQELARLQALMGLT